MADWPHPEPVPAEARSAELAKANDALRRTLDVLATSADTDTALGHALCAIAETQSASSSRLIAGQ